MLRRKGGNRRERMFLFSWRDAGVTALILAAATLLCFLMRNIGDGENYVSMVFLFAVALVSRTTSGYFYGVAASVVGVFGVNYAFTKPYMALCFSLTGYPLTFITMLAVAVLISGMTTQLKRQVRQNYNARLEDMRANLLRAVSHDLRTPLTSISGAASVLSRNLGKIDEKRQRALLNEISGDAEWLIRMVENLLSITRINAERASVKKVPEAAEEIVSEAVRKYRKRFGAPAAEIAMPGELIMAPMDAILIEQVITNLLENAALHATGATWVRVTVKKQGCEAVFEVEDNGGGIEPDKLPVLFDGSASSYNDSAANSRSMGIGLSVCRTIISAHGGTLTAENVPGGGARFRFTLPTEEGEGHAQFGNHTHR